MRDKSTSLFLLIASFLLLTFLVAKQVTRPLDLATTIWIQGYAASEWDVGFSLFTLLGSIEFSCFALLVMCWYLYRKYEWSGAFLYLFFFVTLSLVELIWKYVVASTGPAPEFDRNPFRWGVIAMITPYSFPSGHTFRSIFLLGIWFQWLERFGMRSPQSIWIQKVLIGLLAFGIGLSRIYLGDHWLSDVIGGILLAMIGLELAAKPREPEFRPA